MYQLPEEVKREIENVVDYLAPTAAAPTKQQSAAPMLQPKIEPATIAQATTEFKTVNFIHWKYEKLEDGTTDTEHYRAELWNDFRSDINDKNNYLVFLCDPGYTGPYALSKTYTSPQSIDAIDNVRPEYDASKKELSKTQPPIVAACMETLVDKSFQTVVHPGPTIYQWNNASWDKALTTEGLHYKNSTIYTELFDRSPDKDVLDLMMHYIQVSNLRPRSKYLTQFIPYMYVTNARVCDSANYSSRLYKFILNSPHSLQIIISSESYSNYVILVNHNAVPVPIHEIYNLHEFYAKKHVTAYFDQIQRVIEQDKEKNIRISLQELRQQLRNAVHAILLRLSTEPLTIRTMVGGIEEFFYLANLDITSFAVIVYEDARIALQIIPRPYEILRNEKGERGINIPPKDRTAWRGRILADFIKEEEKLWPH